MNFDAIKTAFNPFHVDNPSSRFDFQGSLRSRSPSAIDSPHFNSVPVLHAVHLSVCSQPLNYVSDSLTMINRRLIIIPSNPPPTKKSEKLNEIENGNSKCWETPLSIPRQHTSTTKQQQRHAAIELANEDDNVFHFQYNIKYKARLA